MTKNVLIQNRIKYWIINSSLTLHVSRGFDFILNPYDELYARVNFYREKKLSKRIDSIKLNENRCFV